MIDEAEVQELDQLNLDNRYDSFTTIIYRPTFRFSLFWRVIEGCLLFLERLFSEKAQMRLVLLIVSLFRIKKTGFSSFLDLPKQV